MKKGITLIEILVVMVIVSVIAAFSLPMLNKARVKGLKVKTKSIIASLEAAISMYESDFGDYPAFDGGADNSSFVFLLQGPSDNENWHGPYMRFKKEDMDENSNLIDPWKTSFSYKYPQSEHSNTPYLIISAGPDREFDTNDDIDNW